MEQVERRIRSLKLRGGDHSRLLQVRYMLEEAFRTATLPGLPPNAMVLIRYLDLGTIHAGLSSVQLAETISVKVHSLAAQAICIDQQPNDDAKVVWFSDSLQPYQLLLQKLLDNGEAREWYWRSLFPGQMPALNEAQINELFLKSCQTTAQGLAVPLLIQACLQPPRIAKLLQLLTPALVSRLLHEQGMSPAALPGSAAQRTLQPNPERSSGASISLIDPPEFNIPWRNAINRAVELWGNNEIRTKWLALQGLLRYRPAYIEHRDTFHRIDVSYWMQSWSAEAPHMHVEEGRSFAPKKHGKPHPLTNENPTPVADTYIHAQNATDQTSLSETTGQVAEPISRPNNIPDAGLKPEPQLITRGADFSPTVSNDQHSGEFSEANSPPAQMTGQFSPHAGFAFLIPLFQRLGLAELLQQHDVLLARDFPRQLLWTMARRFALQDDDPCKVFFDPLERASTDVINGFHAPGLWWKLREKSSDPERYFPLKAKVLRLPELINSFQLVSALFLRRYCDLTLRNLIKRPGTVVMTETHWDVIFDINQTDLRLRRMALDSDPGWVAWLGKVVQFHYVRDGEGYV